jgi:hypothetical protein
VNVDTGEFAALTAEVAALSRKISALNGKVTVMGNALKHDGGLIQATHHAFSIGLEIGERERAEGHQPAAIRERHRQTRPDHLRPVE